MLVSPRMTDPLLFLLAALAVLATPGPTNTLLATSGAAAGLRASLPLMVAEMAGYTLSILILTLAVGPVLRAEPMLDMALRLACGLYLARVARRLWAHGGNPVAEIRPVSFRQVFVTTLLNPKGALFAFAILPGLSAPHLLALMGCISGVATGWVTLGVCLGGGLKPRAACRLGAVVLAALAFGLSVSALRG